MVALIWSNTARLILMTDGSADLSSTTNSECDSVLAVALRSLGPHGGNFASVVEGTDVSIPTDVVLAAHLVEKSVGGVPAFGLSAVVGLFADVNAPAAGIDFLKGKPVECRFVISIVDFIDGVHNLMLNEWSSGGAGVTCQHRCH